jgi:hypothetical protein
MLVAHHLARQSLPEHSSKFSRHDFTLPQLFACLAVKEQMGRSYRGAEALLKDADHWCRAIGMRKVPDHNTLCRAAGVILTRCRTDRLLDVVARWAAAARILGLSLKPLAGDATHFEDRHVSRYFEFRRGRGGGGRGRRRKVKSLPKLAAAVASACHLIVSAWAGTGSGSDGARFEGLLYDAWRRVPNRRFKAAFDAGFDGEHHHELARRDMGIATLIPATIGRPSKAGAPPSGRWRRHMRRLLRTKRSRRACGYTQRWQVETVNSMLKRNLGSALRGKTKASRVRDLRLKVLVHNLMILRRKRRVETEQKRPSFSSPPSLWRYSAVVTARASKKASLAAPFPCRPRSCRDTSRPTPER